MIRIGFGRRARIARLTSFVLATLVLEAPLAYAAPPAAPSSAGSPAAPSSSAASPAAAPAKPIAMPATPATKDAPPPTDAEEASTHFKRGLQLFDEGDYTLALVEFERVYQLAPNYRALYNIALVDMQLGRYADAARTLDQYVHDGGAAIAPARLTEVKKTLDELKFRTATVEISTNTNGGEVTLDGKPLDPSSMRAPMVIDAGEHTLRATAPGYQPANKTVTLAGGDRASVHLQLVSLALPRFAAEPVEHHRIFWPGFIATGALAAGAIVSGGSMLDANSHLHTLQNSPTSTEAERESWASRVNSTALVADICTGAAIVAGGVSIYLSLRPDHSSKSVGFTLSPTRVAFSGAF